MAVGLKYGKTQEIDNAATEKTRELTRKFIAEFSKKNSSINCTKLLGYNLSNPDDLSRARELGLFKTKCTALVRDATEILDKIL